MEFIYENFKNIYEFQKAMKTRPVNPVFNNQASITSSKDFTQTKSYEEAEEFLMNGWNVKVEEMKQELDKFVKAVPVQKTKQFKNVVGFAPCIPNSIRGVPKSMIASKKIKSERNKRTMYIVLNNTASCNVEGEELMKAGMTCLKLALLLERARIKTRIDVAPCIAVIEENPKRTLGCTVTVKDYRQPFNLSKMAFPIGHASFFRRFGFRYIEVQQGKISEAWASGYGVPIYKGSTSNKEEYLKKTGILKDGAVYIEFTDCKNSDFDPYKLAEMKGITLKEM